MTWRQSNIMSANHIHLSHCEIKFHSIWSVWKSNPIRLFKSHRIFRPSYNTFYEEKKNINYTWLCLAQASYIDKRLLTTLGELQRDFYKNLTEFDQISLKNLPHLTDFNPQPMAWMQSAISFLPILICRVNKYCSSMYEPRHVRKFLANVNIWKWKMGFMTFPKDIYAYGGKTP